MKKKKAVLDNAYIGFGLGILVPVLAFYLYYRYKFSDLGFMEYLKAIHQYHLLFKTLSLCVLTDLPVFYLFLQFKFLRGARGLVAACFIFAFMVLGYRIFN